jgi:clan AA aspartic protease
VSKADVQNAFLTESGKFRIIYDGCSVFFNKERKSMGAIYAEITLENGGDAYKARLGEIPMGAVRKMTVNSLVDTGAYMLTISEMIQTQLGLPQIDRQLVDLANGSEVDCPIVGPVTLRFQNRITICPALVLPGADEVLFGAIPMEGMDVVIDMKKGELLVNPEHPYIAVTKVK